MSHRQGVAIIILSKDSKHILLGERANERGQWQIPQGGAEKDEFILQTLERELMEEVGIPVPKILRHTTEYIRYDWPEGFNRKNHRGQEHVYFLLDGSAIDIMSLKPSEEFADFKWATIHEAIDLCVSWKREALTTALRHLGLVR
jgi:putative (di)nucleoside polyphosphate hydrolase